MPWHSWPSSPATTLKAGLKSSPENKDKKQSGSQKPATVKRLRYPFADVEEEQQQAGVKQTNYLHLRIQQRNGRKTLTTLQGLSQDVDIKRLLKAVKKSFACNGTAVDDPEHGEILQLQGDQRLKLAEFLVVEGIAKKADIKVHGF
ncbi:Eukaryotic translation initiation factor eIF-1 [Apophysomyces sp. BC1034]|nr:Eukaryotic translation initiation factor eIF-1 [Apophysomyces sp. BC1034]